MSSGCFEGELILRAVTAPAGSRQRYALMGSLTYVSASLSGNGRIVAPAGFTTDFASIPTVVQIYLDDDDPVILRPSVVHDWVYACAGRLPEGRTLTRREADRLFIEGMRALGARRDQCAVVWAAVRLCGWWAWGRRKVKV